jgi:putative tryptophan/tyrosine transport system substrate-binding protein
VRRREFITLLGGAGTWPLAAQAQQGERMRRIGVLQGGGDTDDPRSQPNVAAFLQALQQLGWTDGRNVKIDYRWPAGDADKARKYAAELVALAPDVILAISAASLGPLLQATRAVPIVFVAVADPVGAGFVDSLSRPGGNATGFLLFDYSLSTKWLELLKEIAPRVARVAFLFNPVTAPHFEYYLNPFKAAAASFAVEAIAAPVRDRSELDSVIAAQARAPNGGLIVMVDAFMVTHRAEITLLAARYRLPAVYSARVLTELGGLLSYGSDLSIIFGARRPMPIASSRMRSRASFRSRPRSSSSW